MQPRLIADNKLEAYQRLMRWESMHFLYLGFFNLALN